MPDAATHHRWDDLPREELSAGIGRRLINGERLMIAHVYFETGAVVPKHAHDNEQLTYILEGRLHIPSNLPHRAEALEDTLDVDVFSPPRQDWLDGTDAYLRGPSA
jgi:quercetin dioxygenase-like cupin family protein